MKQSKLEQMSVDQLVGYFAEIGIGQDQALLENAINKFNRLYDQKVAVVAELKSRDDDQRRALIPLYEHSNMQVKLNAANSTLAVAPKKARDMLQKIADSKFYPQAGDAGMALLTLERGIYKPT